MEAKLDERLLLMHVQLAEDLGGVEEVLVLEDPVKSLLASAFAHSLREQGWWYVGWI